MMTGQLPSATRGYDNAAYLASTIPTFAHYARAAGYRTVLDGKMHFVGPDQLHGFEERRTTDIYPADFGWTPDWRQPDERVDWWYHNMDIGDRRRRRGGRPTSCCSTTRSATTAMRALHDLAPRDDERPWLLVASFTHPHDPYVTRRQLLGPLRRRRDPDAGLAAADVAPDDPHTARLRDVSAMDEVDRSPTSTCVAARRAYFGNVSYVDEWTGRLVDTLRRARLRRRHGDRAPRRPRRHARRARALVQDELLRGLGAHAAGRARAAPLRGRRVPRPGVAGRRAADDRRPRRR